MGAEDVIAKIERQRKERQRRWDRVADSIQVALHERHRAAQPFEVAGVVAGGAEELTNFRSGT